MRRQRGTFGPSVHRPDGFILYRRPTIAEFIAQTKDLAMELQDVSKPQRAPIRTST